MLVPDDVVEIDFHGSVFEHQMVFNRHELQRFEVLAEFVRNQRGFTGCNFPEDSFVTALRNNGKAIGNGFTHAS